MTMAQQNKPMTVQILPELARQSAVTPTYLRGLGGLPQLSPSAPQSAPGTLRHCNSARSSANIRDRENGQVDLIDLAEIAKITIDVEQTSR